MCSTVMVSPSDVLKQMVNTSNIHSNDVNKCDVLRGEMKLFSYNPQVCANNDV